MSFTYPYILILILPITALYFYITKSNKKVLILFTAISFMIISASRPVVKDDTQLILEKTYTLLIALDVSKSMNAEDIKPNRLKYSIEVIKRILNKAIDYKVGLIIFSDNSHLLIPPTRDFESFKIILENSNFQNISNGTNIKNLLSEVSIHFKKGEEDNNLLLISDGSDQKDFKKEINIANSFDINIYNIDIAMSNLVPIPINKLKFLKDKNKKTVFVSKNNNFKQLSINTGGSSFGYPISNNNIKELLQIIRNDKPEENMKEYIKYNELFYYPLFIAFILLYIYFFNNIFINKIKMIVLVPFFLYPTIQEASFLDFIHLENANKAYENKEYKKAIYYFEQMSSTNEVLYNIATSYYKLKDYKKSLIIYSKIKTKDKNLLFKQYYNMANCSIQLKKYFQAKSHLIIATKLKKDINAVENLELVNKLLEEIKYKKVKSNNINSIYVCKRTIYSTSNTKKSKSKKSKESIEKDSKNNKKANKELKLEQPKRKESNGKNEISW